MRIHIATDHAGMEFSTRLQHHLAEAGHDVVDHGPVTYDPLDDYPAFCIRAAQAVAEDQARGIPTLGVVFGGSGNGEQIAANKVAGIRAVTAHDSFSVERGVLSNDAQVLTMGQRVIGIELARRLVREWLTYRFDPTSASAAKVAVIGEYESTGSC